MKIRRYCGTRGHVRQYLPGWVIIGLQKSKSLALASAATPRAKRIVPIFPPGPTGGR